MKKLLRLAVLSVVLFSSVASLEASDAPPPGWLGVLLGAPEAPPRGADATEAAPEIRGVLVRGVVAGSPAEDARIRAKDSIVAVDGSAVSGAPDLMARLRALEPGSSVTLSVVRGGRDLEMSTTVGTRPASMERLRMVTGWLGVEAIDLPPSLREHFGAPQEAGVLVSKVVEGSPAEAAGIRVGDVVYEADGRPVGSLGSLARIASEGGVDNTIEVVLARDGAKIVVGPTIARTPEEPPR